MLCCISPSAYPRLSQSQRQSMAESQSGFSLLVKIYLYSWHAFGALLRPCAFAQVSLLTGESPTVRFDALVSDDATCMH
jgi:hypothetical protein